MYLYVLGRGLMRTGTIYSCAAIMVSFKVGV